MRGFCSIIELRQMMNRPTHKLRLRDPHLFRGVANAPPHFIVEPYADPHVIDCIVSSP